MDTTFKTDTPWTFRANGKGHWTKSTDPLVSSHIEIVTEDWGSMYVFVYRDNPVDGAWCQYTDKQIQREVQAKVRTLLGRDDIEVWWSEQGMQEDEYGHFDMWVKK